MLAVRCWLCGWSGGSSGAFMVADGIGMYGAVTGAAFSAVASDGDRLCCPMIDFRTEADLLRRWPAAGVGAGAAIARAATTG